VGDGAVRRVVTSKKPREAREEDVAAKPANPLDAVSPPVAALVEICRCGREDVWRAVSRAVFQRVRSPQALVRRAAVDSVAQLYRHVGADLLVALPEQLPALAELLADPAAEVKGAAEGLKKVIEEYAGESIDRYLEE